MVRLVVCPVAVLLSFVWISTPGRAEDLMAQEVKIEVRSLPENPLFGYSVRLVDVEHGLDAVNNCSDSTGVFALRSTLPGKKP